MIRVVLAALLLTGCTIPLDMPGKCRAGTLQGWVGQRYGPRVRRTIADRSHARHLRVIRPGAAATMDYRESRINVVLDARDSVTRLYCG